MSSDPAIEARGLGKAYAIFRRPEDRLKQMLVMGRRRYYHEFWALQNVDLAVRAGETLGVIGRNGSGKSTLLQLICGTSAPTAGEVSTRGRIAAMLELGAGFNPEFTGRENVYLAASILGLEVGETSRRFDEIAAFAGIGDFMDQPLKVYSSGMYARLAFAVAAHVDAEILIVDEILAVGDAAFTQKCMAFIRAFRREGTLLFASHDISAVLNLCDRTLWLDRGTVRALGPTREVCDQYVAALYAEADDGQQLRVGGHRRQPPASGRPVRDPRDTLLKASTLRNVVDVFTFDPEGAWFGRRGATIEDVGLYGTDGARLEHLTGGEEILLRVRCLAHAHLERPIVGFFVKDRLGQRLFGDNTYLTCLDRPTKVPAGEGLVATFHFQMPYLPAGDYSICASIADGTQEEHVQHQWIDDAVFFKVSSSHVTGGLVGLPMIGIRLDRTTPTRGDTGGLG